MLIRHLAVVIACAGLTVGGPFVASALADAGQPTAAALFEQGTAQYEAGELEAARQTLRGLDQMQLPPDQRRSYYLMLQAIDQTLNASGDGERDAAPTNGAAPATAQEESPGETPADRLAEADRVAADDPAAAVALYRAIIDDPETAASIRALAEARLAHTQRRINADITAVRAMIDEAARDLEGGDDAAAAARLRAVRDSGVRLGWFDQQRVERQLALIEERRADAGVTRAPAPAAAEPMAERRSVERRDTRAATEDRDPNVLYLTPDAANGARETSPTPVEAPRTAEGEASPEAAEPVEAERAGQVTAVARAAEEAEPAEQAQDDLLARARLLYAQQVFAEGQEAEQAGQLALAEKKFADALALDRDNEKYKARLEAVRSRRNAQLAPDTVLQRFESERRLRAEAAEAEYRSLMNEARRLGEQGNFSAALDAVAAAKLKVDNNRRFLTPARYAELRARAEDLSSELFQRQNAFVRRQAEQQQEEVQQNLEVSRAEAEQEREEEVQRLLRRAMNLRKDMKYDEALKLLDQALFLDSTNIAAQGMKEAIEDAKILVEGRELRRRKRLMQSENRLNTLEASIPYQDLITYPADWPELTKTRLAGLDITGGESEVNRRVSQELQQPVPIEFQANQFSNVIEYLRNTTGVDFFVNWSVLEAIGVERDSPITLKLSNVPAEQALRLVLQQVGSEFDPVDYSIIEGVVHISTERDLKKTTDIRVYDIRDLLVQVPNFTDAPEFDLTEALSETAAGGGGGGASQIFSDEEEEDDELPTREELIQQITLLIQDTVGNPDDWLVGDSSLSELNGNLIVRTTASNHRNIIGLLSQLRETRAIQISVESRFLVVDDNFLEEIGVDLDFQINDVGGGFGPIGVAQDSVSLAQRVGGALTPNTFAGQSSATEPGVFIPGQGFVPQGGVLGEAPNTGRSLDLNVSYLDDIEVNLLVHATQANKRAVSLTAPRVTFFNGQRAYVVVARQITFISDLEPIPDAIGFDVTLSVVNSGVVLDVEGTISADRRYVTLTLRPSLATLIEPIDTFEIVGVETGDGDDDDQQDIVFTGLIQAPEIEITSVRATVSVPDRGTLMLGGQRLVGESEVEAGVPVLSKIPILNRFFTNTSTVKDERTLLILIKPTIIIQGEEEERNFPGLTDDPEGYNVGRSF